MLKKKNESTDFSIKYHQCVDRITYKKTQWTDYIEEVLSLVTVNNNNNQADQQHQRQQQRNTRSTMNQNSFPYRICDISLPDVATGYVYMLVSLRHPNYSYIGQTSCI